MSQYRREILQSINIGILGQVKGFQFKDETIEAAAARCVLEAEQYGNNGTARIHLEIRIENQPLPGQSRLARTLAVSLATQLMNPIAPIADAFIDQITNLIDSELETQRRAFELLTPCSIPENQHPEGQCTACVAWSMRNILILREK